MIAVSVRWWQKIFKVGFPPVDFLFILSCRIVVVFQNETLYGLEENARKCGVILNSESSIVKLSADDFSDIA